MDFKQLPDEFYPTPPELAANMKGEKTMNNNQIITYLCGLISEFCKDEEKNENDIYALRTAVRKIRYRIGKEPKYAVDDFGGRYMSCPNCGEVVKGLDPSYRAERFNFCPICGQKSDIPTL